MKLNGINVNEEDTITDPTLLMEVSGYTHKRLVSMMNFRLCDFFCYHKGANTYLLQINTFTNFYWLKMMSDYGTQRGHSRSKWFKRVKPDPIPGTLKCPDRSSFLQSLLNFFSFFWNWSFKHLKHCSFGHWLNILNWSNQCDFVVFLKVQEKLKQWSDSFVEAFESQRFDEAVKCIQRMTYYERACEEIVKKLWGK